MIPGASVDLRCGDSLLVLRQLADNSVDSIVTDPPYELGFMGKAWDASGIANNVDLWAEALRVLRPGGHLLAFSGSRTYHRMTCAIEDAGFEVRDQIMWVYGSGFPKSQNVSMAIDKQAGARGHAGTRFNAVGQQGERTTGGDVQRSDHPDYVRPKAVTPEAQQWDGWGTALKPSHEPICVARKPLAKGLTVAANVLQHGTGAINIDGCRVGDEVRVNGPAGGLGLMDRASMPNSAAAAPTVATGRWPANLIHDGSDEVVALFPHTQSGSGAVKRASSADGHGNAGAAYGAESRPAGTPMIGYGDAGSAARFFYTAKASKSDRNEGCEALPHGNNHPTVKPRSLMQYLCRLVTPPGGLVLDPFMGSGSTGVAARLEGFRFVGIDLTPEYVEIARARIATVDAPRAGQPAQMDLLGDAA